MTTPMTAIKLHAGDQVQLPSSIDIQGKNYKLIPFDSHKSKRLKGLTCVRFDLSKIQDSIEKHLKSPSRDFEYFYALVILYRKCWSETGDRYFKLEKERDLKNISKSLLDFHDFLVNIGNKYVAHPDQPDYDQSSILLVMDDQKAISVYPFRMTLENLDSAYYQTWLHLLTYLDKNLKPLVDKMEQSVLDEYNSSLHKNQPNQKF